MSFFKATYLLCFKIFVSLWRKMSCVHQWLNAAKLMLTLVKSFIVKMYNLVLYVNFGYCLESCFLLLHPPKIITRMLRKWM